MSIDKLPLLPDVERSWSRFIASRAWWLPLLLVTGGIQLAVVLRALLQPFPPPLDVDAALFQHAGWYISQGAVPYVHIWDPTPPLSFFAAWFLSLLAGGNIMVLHVLSVLLTASVAVFSSLLIASTVALLTGNRVAGTVGGLTLYTFVLFYLHAALGFGFKHLALFCGFLAIWLVLKERPMLGGLFGAASALIWLPGAIFGLLALGILGKERQPARILRYVAGALILALLTMLPIIYRGGVPSMLTELSSSFLASEEKDLPLRFERGLYFLQLSAILLLPAGLMFYKALRERRWPLWWVVAGTAIFGVQVLFFDFDNYPDLFPLMAFTALLVGLYLANARRPVRRTVIVAVLGLLLLAPVVHLGLRSSDEQAQVTETRIVQGQEMPTMQTLYWETIVPDSCHYRFSETEQKWLQLMETRGVDTECEGL